MPDAGPSAVGSDDPAAEETMLLTVFLRHDQSQDLVEQRDKLDAVDWWNGFPPAGCEVVSWVVAMGVGQIVTLRLPPRLLQSVNVELERRAWGVFQTDFYPTYDFRETRERLVREANERTGRA
jgi:hypothetical protein